MYRKLVLLSLILILLALATGINVRASGAGLACPDVPTCFGTWWPPETLSFETLKHYPGFFYDFTIARLHMVHRLVAMASGILMLGLFAGAWWHPKRSLALTGSMGLLLLIGLQIVLGSLIVHSHLMPLLVTAHWLVAVIMVVTSWLWYLRLSPNELVEYTHTAGLRKLALAAGWLTLLQMLLGVWVGANYATLSCPDFPTCGGSWMPQPNWGAFDPGRLGLANLGEWSFPDHEARMFLHWLHRLGALLVFVVVFALGISISSNPKVPHLSKVGLLLNFLLLVVIGLGLSVVIKEAPAVLVVAHGVTAVMILLTVTGVAMFLRQGPPVSILEQAKPAVPPEAAPVSLEEVPAKPVNLYDRLTQQLGKTRTGLTGFLAALPLAGRTLDQELVEEIETHLLMADVGVEATREIIDHLTTRLEHHQLRDTREVMRALHDTLLEILEPCSRPLQIDPTHKPFVILVVGVNGVGKTTTIGKLAKRLQNQGHSVMLAAGDTFRAAAVEQLKVWGERNGVPVVAQETGADSASVIFDAFQAAKARGIDVLIADTAGRLHTKSNLMEELAKIKRIMGKIDASAPHEVLLVLDSTTGQNALSQTEQFNQAVGVTGIVLTKLDGTAKGGVIFALAKRYGIPIRYIGIGEGADDLQDFDARAFVDALFEQQREAESQLVH